MPTFTEHINRWNRYSYSSSVVQETSKEIQDSCAFRRGNLVIHKESRGHLTFHNRYLLILGIVTKNDWYAGDVTHYLVKTSNTTRPTLNSKGHYLSILPAKEVEKVYNLSIRDAFKNL